MSTSGSSLRAFAGRFLIALLVGSLLMVGAVKAVNREVSRKIDRIPKIELTTAPERPGGANYLLVGSDSRDFVSNQLEQDAFGDAESESGKRSDTIMVVHVEPKAERTFVMSFPRDLWVNIPGHGYGKINSAYNFGEQTLIDTLKANFDIDIQHYIDLNFLAFVDLVNSLGTVSVYVPFVARDEYTGLDVPNPGCVALDGEQALQYVRSRYLQYQDPASGRWVYADITPDISRIGRQQDFMRKLAGLAVQKSLSNPLTANLVADKIVNRLHVDDAFDKSSVFSLLDAFRTLNPDDQSALEFATLPWKGGPDQFGQSVLYYNPADPNAGVLLDRLRTFDDRPKPQPAPSSIRIRVVNATGRPELATAVTRTLKDQGFATVEPVESSAERIPNVEVRVSAGQFAKGKLLLRYIEPTAQLALVADSDVDVTLVLGKAFQAVAVPADAQVGIPAADVPATEAPAEAPPEPVLTPTTSTTLPVILPAGAPRGAC